MHYLQKYCRKGVGAKANTSKVIRSLRDRVTFQQANLQESLARFGHFDLIFLRNVMISL
ncbi:CheR family methyltransferase [Vibrio metschnikovii]